MNLLFETVLTYIEVPLGENIDSGYNPLRKRFIRRKRAQTKPVKWGTALHANPHLVLRYDLGGMSRTWSARLMFAPVHLVIQPERELRLPSQQSDSALSTG